MQPDETGLLDWENQQTKLVLVRAIEEELAFHYPVDMSIMHHTLLCCVITSGYSECPMSIVPNAKARQFCDAYVRDRIDVIIEIRQPDGATGELFYKCFTEILFPALQVNRQLPGCMNKLVILFADNCSIYCSDQLLREFAKRGGVLILYPSRISNRFQVLDHLLLGRLTSNKKYLQSNDSDLADNDHFTEFFKASELILFA
jgi:hypothetical protein